MTTAILAKLIKGTRSLTISSGRYALGDDFAPPDVALSPLIAEGTSANRTGGGKLAGVRAGDREWRFNVHITITSQREAHRAARDLRDFFLLAGDETEPLYLYYRANSDVAIDPVYGQAGLRYEVLHGGFELSEMYTVADLRGKLLPTCPVSVVTKPYALGTAMQLFTATGGVYEDDWGQQGNSRGLAVGEAFTNKMTNPVFGHATYDNGWTTGAGLISRKNTNPEFVLFGVASAQLTSKGSGVQRFSQTINVGNTNTHQFGIYVKKRDSSAVTSSDVQIEYNTAAKTTTWLSLGNGWYFGTASNAGFNSGVEAGVTLGTGTDIYLGGMVLIENDNFCRPMIYGDMLGCAWTGTAHASTSTRTAGSAKLSTTITNADGNLVFNPAHGSARVVVTPYVASTVLSGLTATLFRGGGTSNFQLRRTSTDVWTFIAADGTSINSASATFSAGDHLVLHVTWANGALALYLNGASIASGSTYNPTALAATVQLGSDSTPANYFPGTIHDFTLWDVALTATEVSNDYTNVSPMATAGERIGAVPWLWTKDGDDQVDAVDGVVSAAAKDNWCVVGGVPGSAPALTELKLDSSTTVSNLGSIWFSRLLARYFYNPGTLFFSDQGGTADSGNSSGDAYLTASVGTGATNFNWLTYDALGYALMQGKEVCAFVRLKDAGSNLTAGMAFSATGGLNNVISDYVSLAADTTFRMFKTLTLTLKPLINVFRGTFAGSPAAFPSFKRTTGSGNVSVDFFAILPRPITQIYFPFTSLVTNTTYLVKNRDAFVADQELAQVFGDTFELEPGGYNLVMMLLSSIGGASVVTYTMTFTATYVTPRYALV